MDDLNNLFYYARIVEHRSLSATAEALGVTKSLLSQRLAKLEAKLGVRLIHRTTRKLQITETGQRYYEHCRAILDEIARADGMIESAREVPRGKVRVTCPLNFSQIFLAPLIAKFMTRHPEIEVALNVGNEEVDLISEGYDLALRILPYIKSSSLIVRSFPVSRPVLMASRDFVERHGQPEKPEDLQGLPSVAGEGPAAATGRYQWPLSGPDETTHTITHHPRLLSEDLFVLKEAVLAGIGMTPLPRRLCVAELADGRLVELLPKWRLPENSLHLIYPSRKGLVLAVRTLIDFLSHELQSAVDLMKREEPAPSQQMASRIRAAHL